VTSTTGGFALGTVAADRTVTCLVQMPTPNLETTQSIQVGFDLVASIGDQKHAWPIDTNRELVAVHVTPAAAPPTPKHGYSLSADTLRPSTVQQRFTIEVIGSAAFGSLRVLPSVDGVSCVFPTGDPRPSGARRYAFDCTATHQITAADLALGHTQVGIKLNVTHGIDLATTEHVTIATPHEAVSVRATELSAADRPDGYRNGDTIRLLLHVDNTGSLPIEVAELALGQQPPSDSLSAPLLQGRFAIVSGQTQTACTVPIVIQPRSGFDCQLDYVVMPEDVAAGAAILRLNVATTQGVLASTVIRLAASKVPPRFTELPATGTDLGALVTVATVLVIVGICLVSGGQPSSSTPFPCRHPAQRADPTSADVGNGQPESCLEGAYFGKTDDVQELVERGKAIEHR
jgi:hypothetical protein